MVLLAQVPPSVAKADRGKAALKLNSAKIQKVLRDYVSERAHTVRPTLRCARWLTQHFLSCMQFPNQNKLVTRDQFVEVVERAIDPEDSLVDPSSVTLSKLSSYKMAARGKQEDKAIPRGLGETHALA